MSVLHQDSIWDKVTSIKYDVPNDKLEMLDQYKKDIDTFYEKVLEKNAQEVKKCQQNTLDLAP